MVKLLQASLLCFMALETLGQFIPSFNYARDTTFQEMAAIKRSIDGKGNNIDHPEFGAINVPFDRLSQGFVAYQDKADVPVNWLPSARQISSKVGALDGPFKPNKRDLSILFTFWGQLLDHDLTLSKPQKLPENNPIEKMDIAIPKGDSFLDKAGTGEVKLDFPRAKFVKKQGSYRNQINTLTAWHDSSNVYGHNQKLANELRAFEHGKMKVSADNLLPFDQDPTKKGFFIGGDQRTNENIPLTAMHNIWVREHNRLCDQIIAKNPKMSDEQIYTAARNYVIGLMQKITYKDWLPELLGETIYNKTIGQYYGYDKKVSPNIKNQFATAAFRIGHPLLFDQLSTLNEKGQVIQKMRLHEMFSRPDFYKNGESLDSVLRGLIKQPAKDKSCAIVNDVRNFLFTDPAKKEHRLDLFSLNIQRSRDHGLPSYNQCRQQMGFKKYQNFSQITSSQGYKIQSAYNHVDHVELFVGIVCQEGMKDGVMGEFGGSLVGEGFRRIRDGDRFWYEIALPKKIVKEIENTTFGDVIARNTGIKNLPENVFKIEKKPTTIQPTYIGYKYDRQALKSRMDQMLNKMNSRRYSLK